jgi:hypothetical protein
MFVHGHPRALGWVKGHYRAPNAPTGEQLGLDLEFVTAEIPQPRAEGDQPVRSRSPVSASAHP